VPLVARPEGIAVHAAAEHPAAGLLFLEYYLTNAQKIGLGQGRQPASTAVPGGGLPTQYKYITVDVNAVVNEFDKWSSIYDKLVRLSGHKVVSD
jgi:iron(III) transport system substrate-binding protein